MASPSTVITLGYGSFGSVNLLPTLGYGSNNSNPVTGPYCFGASVASMAFHAVAANTGLHTLSVYSVEHAVKAGCDCEC